VGNVNTHYTQDIQYRGKTCEELRLEIDAEPVNFNSFENPFDANPGTRFKHYKSNMDSINVCQTSSSDPNYDSRCKVGGGGLDRPLLEKLTVDIYDHYCTVPNTCGRPGHIGATTSLTGYDFSNVTETSLQGPTLDVSGITCATGYLLAQGKTEADATGCILEGGDYEVTGCSEVTCTRPTNASYDFSSVVETSLSGATFGVTGIACATGYAGTATAGVCAADGDYTVTGCAEVTCTRPTTTGYDFDSVSETLSGATFAVTGITCATGYGLPDNAQANVCTADGAYRVSGCNEVTCSRPNDARYDFSDVDNVATNEILSGRNFSVTGLKCSPGHSNSGVPPTASVCLNDGEIYRLYGCGVPYTCTTPTLGPDTVGYDFSGVNPTVLGNNIPVSSIQCAQGYNGTLITAISCQADNTDYIVTGCSENTCSQLSDVQKEIYTFEDSNATTVTGLGEGTCSDNYDGDINTITASCNNNNDFVLGGCSERSGYCKNNTDPNEIDVDCGDGAILKTDRTIKYTSEQAKLSECCDHVTCGHVSIQDVCAAADKVTININATCTETATTSVQADENACNAVTDLTTSDECNAVQLTADSNYTACTYISGSNTKLSVGDVVLDICCRDETCADWISENANTCDASNNRFYCSLDKDDTVISTNENAESTCCSDNGCPCSSLDSASVCPNERLVPGGRYNPGQNLGEMCCQSSDSIYTEVSLSATCDTINILCDGDPSNDADLLSTLSSTLTGGLGIISETGMACGTIPSECLRCQNRTCGVDQVLRTPLPNNTACSGVTHSSRAPDKICLESDCCETRQPFTNMEGFQNNYPVVSMENSYLIEGVENQPTFEIPIRITIEPVDETVKLNRTSITQKIDEGIEIPGLGIKIEKSIRKKNKEKQESKKAMNQYKIIGIIMGIVILVSIIMYVVYRYKKTNPLLDLLS
jgi:hypothetical protein